MLFPFPAPHTVFLLASLLLALLTLLPPLPSPIPSPLSRPSRRSPPSRLLPPLPPLPPRTIRLLVAKLATLHLAPHLSRRGHLPAPPPLCPSCFRLHVRNGTLHLHDPHALRALHAPFRALRLREAVARVRHAVARAVVAHLDLDISVADGVPYTHRAHRYRMPPPRQVPGVVFGVATCNVSDVVPFPMVMADALRRAGGGGGGRLAAGGLLAGWDEAMREVARGGEKVAWEDKLETAVFRGSVRMSARGGGCEEGRMKLKKKAEEEERKLREWEERRRAGRAWPLPDRWFKSAGTGTARSARLLDVRLSGRCGRRLYGGDDVSMGEQGRYKYAIQAEGNAFWADRLMVLLWGGAAVLRQETPCGMWFEGLLRPYRHYVPLDVGFEHAARQVVWARANDARVRVIAAHARRFAEAFLTARGAQMYVDEVLAQYATVVRREDGPVHPDAVQVYPRKGDQD